MSRCHTVPFRDLTDGISKSGLTGIEYLPTFRPFQPEAASRPGLSPLPKRIPELGSGPCHPGVFFAQLVFKISKFLGIRRFIILLPTRHRLERTNSQRSLWRPLICLNMT